MNCLRHSACQQIFFFIDLNLKMAICGSPNRSLIRLSFGIVFLVFGIVQNCNARTVSIQYIIMKFTPHRLLIYHFLAELEVDAFSMKHVYLCTLAMLIGCFAVKLIMFLTLCLHLTWCTLVWITLIKREI